MMRLDVMDTEEHRVQWLLKFIQTDLNGLKAGEWKAVGEELLKVTPAILVERGLAFHYQYPTGTPRFTRATIIKVHQVLKELLRRWDEAEKIRIPVQVNFEASKIPAERRRHQRRCMQIVVRASRLKALQAEFARMLTVFASRIRQCARGEQATSAKTQGPCRTWFYAEDERQYFCTRECSRVERWARFWAVNRTNINTKRRKITGRTRRGATR